MYSNKEHFMRRALLALLFVVVFTSVSAAAERRLGATAAAAARDRSAAQTREQLGAGGGAGTDLRAISRPSGQPQSFTGFPTGTLPGDTAGGGGSEEPLARVAMSGDPLAPIIGPEMVGSKLDRLAVIAAHVGYSIIRLGYSPTVMDTPYSFALMNGKRKVSTLYFDRSMSLVTVQ